MSALPRVAVVTPALHRGGGTEKCLAWMVEDLSRRCDVTVFTGMVAGTDVSRARVCRLPMIRHPRLLRYLTFLCANTVVLGLRRLTGRWPYDLVLATGGDCFWSDVIYAHFCCAAWSDMLRRQKVALPAATPRQRLRNLHYRTFLAVASRIERAIYRRPGVRATIAVSRGTRDELQHHYGVAPERITVIPNAVDDRVRLEGPERARHRREVRALHAIPAEAVVLLFIAAGDWKRKGFPVLLEALARIPERDIRLLAVGREDLRYYRSEAARLGIADRVIFAGFAAEVERYYAAADIFVYPSAYEAFSLVALEAAGAGLPLLVTRINGAEDLVRDGVNGFFIDPDLAGIAARVHLLAADPALRERMGSAAAAGSREYSREAVAERTLRLLLSCTGAPRDRGRGARGAP